MRCAVDVRRKLIYNIGQLNQGFLP